MSKEIKISDWVTEEEFNYSPTGELSAVLYLAEQRSDWFAKGEKAAEERIIKLLEEHSHEYGVALAIALIKGEQKVIHTHEIEVFGAPCDCGTRHEYCGDCNWVEPCESEGEQK